ncbi:MAG: hypothetical protein ACR2HJ_01865 [Fimbriimonadales bacterium]
MEYTDGRIVLDLVRALLLSSLATLLLGCGTTGPPKLQLSVDRTTVEGGIVAPFRQQQRKIKFHFDVALKNNGRRSAVICMNLVHFYNVIAQVDGKDIDVFHSTDFAPHGLEDTREKLGPGRVLTASIDVGWFLKDDPHGKAKLTIVYECDPKNEDNFPEHSNAWKGRVRSEAVSIWLLGKSD